MQSQAASDWWVACLCAGWCGVCRDWRPLFDEAARAHPGLRFAWVDVEDEAEAMGDVEIETFPTLLVAQGDRPLFLGAIPPTASQLARLVSSLVAQPQPSPTLPACAGPLLQRLKSQVFARTAS
jgi:thiol-disulfide isomerase/thioredoxin